MTQSSRHGLSNRAARLLIFVGVFVAGAVFTAPGAAAATITCNSPNSPSCRDVTPIAECLWDNGNGTVSVAWGYNNDSDNTVIYNTGTHNDVSPGATDQGQPEKFIPGRQRNVFVTTSSWLSSAAWRVGNETDKAAWWFTDRCSSKPVSQVGSLCALGLAGIVLVGSALTVLHVRSRHVRNRAQEVTA